MSVHVYEARPRADKRGVDLIADALPFGRSGQGWPVRADLLLGVEQTFHLIRRLGQPSLAQSPSRCSSRAASRSADRSAPSGPFQPSRSSYRPAPLSPSRPQAVPSKRCRWARRAVRHSGRNVEVVQRSAGFVSRSGTRKQLNQDGVRPSFRWSHAVAVAARVAR